MLQAGVAIDMHSTKGRLIHVQLASKSFKGLLNEPKTSSSESMLSGGPTVVLRFGARIVNVDSMHHYSCLIV